MQTNAADDKQPDYARTLAHMAAVETSYVVYPASPSEEDLGRSVDTFAEAYGLLMGDGVRSMAIVFDWKFGVSSGLDAVIYSTPKGFSPSEAFVEQTVDRAITEKIAQALQKEHSKRNGLSAAA